MLARVATQTLVEVEDRTLERLRARAFADEITSCDLALYVEPARALLPKVPEPRDLSMHSPRILAWVRKVAGYCDHDHEVACAITDASMDDPLWPGEAGALKTAAFLIALACTSGAAFHPNRIGGGDGSLGYGIYAIRMPPGMGHLPADVLLLPRTASYVAIDLVRQMIESYPARSLEDLHWFPESDPPSERDRCVAAERAFLTRRLLQEAA